MATELKPGLTTPKSGFLATIIFTVLYYVMHSAVNLVFQLAQIATVVGKLVSSKVSVPESLEAKFSQVGQDLENYKKTLGTLSKIPKHIAFAIMPEKYLDITEESLALGSRAGGVGVDKPEHDNIRNHALESEVDSTIVKSLAKEISWAYAANIHVVSLYDHQGLLRNAHTKLRNYIHEEIQHNINGILKTAKQPQDGGFTTEVPVIKVFNADENTEWMSDLEEEDASTGKPILYIFIFSYDNGKEGLVDTIREVMKEKSKIANNNNEDRTVNQSAAVRRSPKGLAANDDTDSVNNMDANTQNEADTIAAINNRLNNEINQVTKEVPNESKMDSLINDHLLKVWQNKKLPSEPEVLIMHGDVKSTLGFLPWHIRLTEFSWISELQDVGLQDFTDVLIKYGHCNQKLGA